MKDIAILLTVTFIGILTICAMIALGAGTP